MTGKKPMVSDPTMIACCFKKRKICSDTRMHCMPKSGPSTVPFCCMDKVKKRHSQMTNTAKQQHSSDIYDNNKPGK
jgi:hypothetical protein